jgi:hypothetical protein
MAFLHLLLHFVAEFGWVLNWLMLRRKLIGDVLLQLGVTATGRDELWEWHRPKHCSPHWHNDCPLDHQLRLEFRV